MPLEPSFAESLNGKVVTISLQPGWGWKSREKGGEWKPYHPPEAVLPVAEVVLLKPQGEVLGFTGVIRSERAEFNGLAIMALTHTADVVSADDVIPLDVALSPEPPQCTPDTAKLLGYAATPEGAPAYLGFGILVPADIVNEVGA
jgi:hypothetical protein